ncbi:MAG: glycosyltransferase family 9 protein [bacterium]
MNQGANKKLVLLGLAEANQIKNAIHYLKNEYPHSRLAVAVFNREKSDELKSADDDTRIILMGKSPVSILSGFFALRKGRIDMLWIVARYCPRSPLIDLIIRLLGARERLFRSIDGRTCSLADAEHAFPEPPSHRIPGRSLKRVAVMLVHAAGELLFPILNFKSRRRPFEKAKIKRILVLQMDLIGDVILITPCLTALKRNYPNAALDVMVSPWCYDLLRYNPYVDNIITYDARWFRHITPSKKKSTLLDLLSDVFFRLKTFLKRYDVVFELKGEASNVLFAYLTGAPYRIGYCFRSEPRSNLLPQHVQRLLTTHVKYPKGSHVGVHHVEHSLNVLRAAGLKIAEDDKELILNFSRAEEKAVDRLLDDFGIKENDLLIGIHPGASRRAKMWRREGFAAVVDALCKKHDAKIVITGTISEVGLAEGISSLMHSRAYIAAGRLSLLEFACLVKKMSLMITIETSANSISSAVKTPVVVLMSGVPELYGPYRVPHAAIVKKLPCRNIFIEHCGACPYDEYECLRQISENEVIEAADDLLEKCKTAIKS